MCVYNVFIYRENILTRRWFTVPKYFPNILVNRSHDNNSLAVRL